MAQLFSLSHRKVQSFLQCRRQYWFRYLQADLPKPPDPISVPGLIGTGVHRAMKTLCETGDAALGAHELDVYLRMPDHDVCAPGTEGYARAMTLYSRGCEAHASIESDASWAEKETWAPWPSAGFQLLARLDRADRLTPRLWQVIDWKTGAYDLDDTTDAQLDIAHVAVRTTLRVDREATVRAVAWNLRSEQMRVRELNRHDALMTMEKYRALAARIQAAGNTPGDFPAWPGPACRFCEWRPHCPDAEAAWDGTIGGASSDDIEVDGADGLTEVPEGQLDG